jgi:hypothetical protein
LNKSRDELAVHLIVRQHKCHAVPFALISRPEIKLVQELRGKVIGVNAFAAPQEIVAKLIVKHFGLDPDKDVKFLVPGSSEARFASMKRGLTAAKRTAQTSLKASYKLRLGPIVIFVRIATIRFNS